jgi:hypothetical protein
MKQGKSGAAGKRTAKRAAPEGAFDQSKEVRAIARERVGIVKPSRPIPPKDQRKKPKHKKKLGEEEWPSAK